jgi:di/tricarboxylate transporter
MTTPQILIFAILAAMLVLFLWDRLRYDVIALLALLASVLTGVIPPDKAFSGFSNEVVPLIAGALVVSTAIGNSGLVDSLVRRISPYLKSPDLQVGVLVALVTVLSAFMKNIGALAIFLPVAFQLAQHERRSASEFLMPLSFGSLVGGLATLIGTSPNILIAGIRQELVGTPFSMFDFTPVGAGIAVCGVAFLAFGWRLLPRDRKPQASPETFFKIEDYTAEATLPAGSPMVGRTVGDLEALGEGELRIAAIIREQSRRYVPASGWMLFANDILVIESAPHLLDSVVETAKLELVGSKDLPEETEHAGDLGNVEAVVTGDSVMVGASSAQLHLRERYGVNLLAMSRRGRRTTARLRSIRFKAGDVVVLQGPLDAMPDTLAALGCLPLAERNLRFGKPRQQVLSLVILAAAMIASALEIVPVAVAFVAAATLVALFRILTLREIYDAIEWPILVLLGALIPVGEAVRHTGATDLIAHWISSLAVLMPGFGALALVMLITMLLTPILHHAAAVIVMGPVAAALAKQLGFAVDPFLMAVAVGAGSDFLSPIGHQCNTLVLGPGGYRFADYWRLGLPLSTIVLVVGVPLIVIVWPLHG